MSNPEFVPTPMFLYLGSHVGNIPLIDYETSDTPYGDDKWMELLGYEFNHILVIRAYDHPEADIIAFACMRAGQGGIFLDKFAVDEKHQGQGIGSKLMEHLDRSIRKIYTGVFPGEPNLYLTQALAQQVAKDVGAQIFLQKNLFTKVYMNDDNTYHVIRGPLQKQHRSELMVDESVISLYDREGIIAEPPKPELSLADLVFSMANRLDDLTDNDWTLVQYDDASGGLNQYKGDLETTENLFLKSNNPVPVAAQTAIRQYFGQAAYRGPIKDEAPALVPVSWVRECHLSQIWTPEMDQAFKP